MPTFEQLIAQLSGFWQEHGCIQLPPIDVEVGTGTMVPEAFLRLLGPEPWRGAHLQATRRPWDGRYGRSDLRLGKHFQYQVLLKPPPREVQALYLRSLKAVDLDIGQHDIQFLDEDWRVEALGVHGVGWSVRLDGIEVSHLVYLQHAGGVDLDPVTLEVTYGLERLGIVQQGTGSIDRLAWGGDGVDYGEVRQEEEEEFSRYYYEVADVVALRERFEGFQREAQRCLDAGLVLPA